MKPDGEVSCSYYYDRADGQGRLYIGGSFKYVGFEAPFGVQVDAGSGAISYPSAPAPNGAVYAALEDGSGGWYIGGAFTKIGSETRRGLAHIYSTGALDTAFNPDCPGQVYSMVYSNSSHLVIGGSFDSVGGIYRKNIAMVSTSGSVKTWNPGNSGINGPVYTMMRNTDSLVYVGGDFTNAGGQSRNRLAALSVWSNAITSWNPDANNTVHKLKTNGSLIYAVGSFTGIGSQTRNRIACFDRSASIGVLTSFNPDVNGTIYDLAFSSSGSLYIGGTFTLVAGATRNSIAELSSSGSLSSWTSSFENSNGPLEVRALSITSSGTILVGGSFTRVGLYNHSCYAVINLVTGSLVLTNVSANAPVYSIAGTGPYYLGGAFSLLNGVSRRNAACINTQTGIATAWDPSPDGFVHALDMGSSTSGTKLYMGGEFEVVNGNARRAIASFDVDASGDASSTPNALDANLQNTGGAVFVTAIETPDGEGTMFFGGSFSSAFGQPRSNLASCNIATNSLSSWNIGVNGPVWALRSKPLVGDILYVGGDFSSLNGGAALRSGMAALSTTGSSWSSWAPQLSGGTVFAIDVDPALGDVYIGGSFTSVDGLSRSRLARISASGTVSTWNPSANRTVRALKIGTGGTTVGSMSSSVYIGGEFSTVAGVSRNQLAALVLSSGICTNWNPAANDPNSVFPRTNVYTISLDRYNIYAGGNFSSMADNSSRRNWMALTDSAGLPRIEGPSMASSSSTVCANATNTFTLQNAHNLYSSAFTWSVSPSTGVTISGTARTSRSIRFTTAGTYVITVTPSGSNNDVPMTLTVIVRPLPSGGTISGPASVCSGGSGTFTLSGMSNATAFNWSAPVGASLLSSSATTATYQFGTAASYTISVTGSNNGCVASTARSRVVPTALPPTGGSISGSSSICQLVIVPYSISGMTNTSSTTTYTWSATNGATLSGTGTSRTITFPSAGSSIITVQTANGGCSGTTLNRTVTVNPVPTASYAISGISSACEGASATFSTTSTSGVNYSWSLSPSSAGTVSSTGSSATVSFNGTYTAGSTPVTLSMVPSIGSCAKTASTRVVTVNKFPVSTTLSTPTQACSSAVFTCTASATFATSYTWSVSKALNAGTGAGSSRTVTMGSTAVTVKVTPKNGTCSGTPVTRTVNVQTFGCPLFREGDPAELDNSIAGNFDLIAYPNPASDQIRIRLSGLDEPELFTFNWYDLSGKWVKTSEPANLGNGSEVMLYRNELPAGIYTLRLQGEKTHLHARVIFE